jgi:hypothetical protein
VAGAGPATCDGTVCGLPLPRAAATNTRDTDAPPHPDARLGTAQHYRWLRGIVSCVLTLNVLDAFFTLIWISAGLAHEANVLMAPLIERAPALFVAVKLGLVGMGTWVLWLRRDRPLAVIGIFVVFLAYYAILALHLDHLAAIVSHLLEARA